MQTVLKDYNMKVRVSHQNCLNSLGRFEKDSKSHLLQYIKLHSQETKTSDTKEHSKEQHGKLNAHTSIWATSNQHDSQGLTYIL